MKKILLTLSAAALVLASCAKIEIVKVDENRAISFSKFVNNPTKAVTTVETISSFYVFGNYGADWSGQAFDNEINTAVYYWQPSVTYHFGAYADGDGNKIGNATYDASTNTLTFPNYTPDDSKDLVVATAEHITDDDVSNEPKVALTFKHMLSQIKLTFTTDDAATYGLTIKNVKINGAVSVATGEYDATNATWVEPFTKSGYVYEEFNEGKVISSGVSASQVKFVIPQNGTDQLSVTFTAEIAGGEIPNTSTTLTKEFTANLGHSIADIEANAWQNGFCYNYTAKISVKNIVENPNELYPIVFEPSVDDWVDKGNVDVTPAPQN